jgi:putative ATPase
VPELRRVLGEAKDRLGSIGRRTILFLDEIHRFSKSQQDALLPSVESGLITLIGATTENPYFEVNSALLSRCQLFELQPLAPADLLRVVERGASAIGADLAADTGEAIVSAAGGDARNALNILEAAAADAAASGRPLAPAHVEEAARKRPLLYDKGGDAHYDVVSAFIKSMRGSDVDASIYWLATMIAGGEDPKFIARRIIIFASEDVGNADPRALEVAVAAARAVEFVGLPEARINLSQAVAYMAAAPKSNAAIKAVDAALEEVRAGGTRRPPKHLRDAHYAGAKKLGHGVGYRYPHSDPAGAAGQQYLPDGLEGRRFYDPES